MISPETTTVTTSYTTFYSPLGELLLVGEESATATGGTALTAISLPRQRASPYSRTGGATLPPSPRSSAGSAPTSTVSSPASSWSAALAVRTSRSASGRPWRRSPTAPRPPTGDSPTFSGCREARYGPWGPRSAPTLC